MLSILTRRCSGELKNAIVFVQKRSFLLGKRVSERKFRLKDKMDAEWTMIYKAPMEYYLAACNHITTLSAVLFTGFVIQKFIYRDEAFSTEKKKVEMFSGRILTTGVDEIYFAIGFVAINIILRVTAYRYPLRIYKQGSNYTAVFEGQVPFRKDKLEFLRGNVKEIPPRGFLPWRDCRFKINDNRKVIMLYEAFKTPSELFVMMKKPFKQRRYLEDEIVRERE